MARINHFVHPTWSVTECIAHAEQHAQLFSKPIAQQQAEQAEWERKRAAVLAGKAVPKAKAELPVAQQQGVQPNNYGYTPLLCTVTTVELNRAGVVKLELKAKLDRMYATIGGTAEGKPIDELRCAYNPACDMVTNHTAAFKLMVQQHPQLNGKMFIAVPWSKKVTQFAEVHTPAVLIAGQ
jgi:hypothetical protein